MIGSILGIFDVITNIKDHFADVISGLANGDFTLGDLFLAFFNFFRVMLEGKLKYVLNWLYEIFLNFLSDSKDDFIGISDNLSNRLLGQNAIDFIFSPTFIFHVIGAIIVIFLLVKVVDIVIQIVQAIIGLIP